MEVIKTITDNCYRMVEEDRICKMFEKDFDRRAYVYHENKFCTIYDGPRYSIPLFKMSEEKKEALKLAFEGVDGLVQAVEVTEGEYEGYFGIGYVSNEKPSGA